MSDINEIRARVAETGRMLLDKKLVARTWGNISERIDDKRFAISPSGLDYMHTEPEDVAVVTLPDMTWEGRRKPSSEKGIHAAAYEVFSDVNFVIHTHQNFATALGLGGFDNDKLTDEEKAVLGQITTAKYGLPGTKKLAENVIARYREDSKVVFMEHHGVVICGTDRADAFKKAVLLEEVCKKQVLGMNPSKSATQQYAALGLPLKAQLDDMAQMIGRKIKVVAPEKFDPRHLAENGVLIIKGKDIAIYCDDKEDEEALLLLSEKAAISALHTRALGKKAYLSLFDSLLMREVYKLKYSKQKKG